MEETILSIDQAGPDDVRACATVLTRALGDDDVLRAIIRGENRPPRVTALYVALLESGPIAHRTVDVVRVNGGPIVGVGMWTGPDQDESWLQHPIQPLQALPDQTGTMVTAHAGHYHLILGSPIKHCQHIHLPGSFPAAVPPSSGDQWCAA